MRQINMREACKNLSSLVDAAAKGEPFVTHKRGRPLVRVQQVDPPRSSRRIGFMEGLIDHVPDNFDRRAEDEIARRFGVDGETL